MAEVRAATGLEISAADLYALLRLRVDVFVVEQECPYPELDGIDLLPGTRHLWLADGDTVLGCLRIIDDDGVARVGRVCTAAAARGTGAGGRLMAAALDVIGNTESVLGAQTYATGFYERFGYRAEGEPYDEDGIPHITMRRTAPSR